RFSKSNGPGRHYWLVENLRMMGAIFDNGRQVEQWIGDYEWRVEKSRRRVRDKLGISSTVTNLLLLYGKLFVMGEYGRQSLNETAVSLPIALQDLPDYAGDYILVSSFDD